jgi:adenylate kinase family enzyme
MKRILVIGSSGAGKSTFARRLHEATGLKLIHLDKIHWKPNWTEPSKDEWRKILENAIKDKEWIMDGNFGGTMEMRLGACDTAIFLDMPRVICVYRILKRIIIYRKENRPDMAEGCNERFDWKFIKWVWNYPTRSKPKVEELLKRFESEKTVIQLKSKQDIENFFVNYSQSFVLK